MTTLCWFSCGAASAVATKLILEQEPTATVYRIDTGSEHEDNERFANECEAWFGTPITTIRSQQYTDTWDVWERTRYLVGPAGARCTTELKKRPRQTVEDPDDIQVFGYTAEETARADRFREQNPDIRLRTPLIEQHLSKSDCLAIIERVGIELPAMYRLGYTNNNCIGCPKGGKSYWAKIRRDFPDVYSRMSSVERELDVAILKDRTGGEATRLFLDELDPDFVGNMANEPSFECSLMCQSMVGDILA